MCVPIDIWVDALQIELQVYKCCLFAMNKIKFVLDIFCRSLKYASGAMSLS